VVTAYTEAAAPLQIVACHSMLSCIPWNSHRQGAYRCFAWLALWFQKWGQIRALWKEKWSLKQKWFGQNFSKHAIGFGVNDDTKVALWVAVITWFFRLLVVNMRGSYSESNCRSQTDTLKPDRCGQTVHVLSIQYNHNDNTFVPFQSIKGQGKGHPITGHQGPRGGYRYSSTHSQPRR
jgi:hypothetical protein